MQELTLDELRERWSKEWGKEPHPRIGRVMLEKSLIFKKQAVLSAQQQKRLSQLIKDYKRNSNGFLRVELKPGTRIDRVYQGKAHSVIVTKTGFEYDGKHYKSLSKIANDITGSRWNGWVFFGLKKV